MEDIQKYKTARWLIFASTFISMSFAIYDEILVGIFPSFEQVDPNSPYLIILLVILCSLYLSGIFLGSRGLGHKLSLGVFFHLSFSYPTRFILVPYLVLIVCQIIYLEFF